MRKKVITIPFDRYKEPPRQNIFFVPFIWIISWILTRSGHLTIGKERMNGLKPPFLVLGTHHAMMDFYVTPLALMPYRANYVSELEGFENFGEWLYRQAGCLGTRKFVNDLALIHNIKKVLERKDILVLYPEARYANVGTSSFLPLSVAKLAKYLNVPVVTLQMHGNYLQSPIWNLKRRKGVPLEAIMTQLFTKDELNAASVDEIYKKISQALTYDEYEWQYSNHICINDSFRAEGLEFVLYQCPICNTRFQMHTKGSSLFCGCCNAKWEMTKLGKLVMVSEAFETPFSHIPEWYEWQRQKVEEEIDRGEYLLDSKVRIESLPNGKNFIDLGEGRLVHKMDGHYLTVVEYGESKEHTLHFPPSASFSIHTEYDYRGKGQCVTLSTLDNTYFIYPLEQGFCVTLIQFATEYLYQLSQR